MSELLKTEGGAIATAIARGDELARRGKYRRAIQIWRELLDLESEEAVLAQGLIRNKIASSYFRLSRHALRAKKGKAARKAFLKAAERLRQALKYEETPEYYVELGRCYLSLGDWERADGALQKALAGWPGDEKARYYAAIAKLHLGDVSSARELIERSPSASSRRGWWIRLRALADALGGEIPKALTALSDPPAGVPEDVWFSDLVALARASTPSPETAEALEAVLAAAEERLGERRAGLLGEIAGDAYAAMGRYEQAVQLWADASRGTENGRSLARKVGLACEGRIVEALRAREVDEAAAWYRLGVELGVEEAIKPLEGLIDFYLGKSAWSRGDFKEAASRFAACLRRRTSVDVATLLAIVCEAQGDWLKAADAWSTVYELAADRPSQLLEAARRQGLAHIRAGAFDKAASALRGFLDIEADDDIFLYLGCCLIQIHEWKAAIDLFGQAAREVGDRPKLLVGLAVATELAGRGLEEQVRAWRRAAHSSEEAWVYHVWRRRLLQLAHERLNAGSVEQALECYVSLLVEDIDDGESWMWCGAAHLKTGRLERALKCFNAALNATGSAKVALFAGGELLRAGDEEEAVRFFQKAVRLDPQSGMELEIARLRMRQERCGRGAPAKGSRQAARRGPPRRPHRRARHQGGRRRSHPDGDARSAQDLGRTGFRPPAPRGAGDQTAKVGRSQRGTASRRAGRLKSQRHVARRRCRLLSKGAGAGRGLRPAGPRGA